MLRLHPRGHASTRGRGRIRPTRGPRLCKLGSAPRVVRDFPDSSASYLRSHSVTDTLSSFALRSDGEAGSRALAPRVVPEVALPTRQASLRLRKWSRAALLPVCGGRGGGVASGAWGWRSHGGRRRPRGAGGAWARRYGGRGLRAVGRKAQHRAPGIMVVRCSAAPGAFCPGKRLFNSRPESQCGLLGLQRQGARVPLHLRALGSRQAAGSQVPPALSSPRLLPGR